MFWQAPNPKRSPVVASPWRSRLRRAVDLVVAFATLEDVPGSAEGAPAPSAEILPTSVRGHSGLAHEGRTRKGRSVVPQPAGHPDAPGPDHPHRRPLRSAQPRRRPGAVAARVTPCTTPLAPPATRRRGRTRGWETHGPR